MELNAFIAGLPVWTTLIGLYPDVANYTIQLRALESYCVAHPDSAGAYFTLAYQYLTEGHTETAVNVLRRVVALKPLHDRFHLFRSYRPRHINQHTHKLGGLFVIERHQRPQAFR